MINPGAKAIILKEGVWAGGLFSLWALAEQIGIVLGVVTGILVCATALYRFLMTRREYLEGREGVKDESQG